MIALFKFIAVVSITATIIMWMISFWVNIVFEAQTGFFLKASVVCLWILMIAVLAMGVAYIAQDLGAQGL